MGGASFATRFDHVTLRIFLTIADTGSLRAASESLNLSPSAVSRRVSELETDFGQVFFKRHSRGVELTDAGEIMVRKARDVFAAIEGAHDEMERIASGKAGVLALSANGSAFVNGLAEDLRHFNDMYPFVSLELFEQISPDVVSLVLSGKTNIGLIAHTFRVPPEIETRRYCRDRLVLAVPQGHPLAHQGGVSLADIVAQEVIGVIEGSSMSRLIQRVSVMGNTTLHYRYMANTNEVARTLVASGHGVSVLPEQFVVPFEGVLGLSSVQINEDWAEREISLIRRSGAALTRPEEMFWDFLLERAAERGDQG